MDYPTKIELSLLEPFETVTLTVTSTDAKGLLWTSSLGYWASSKGKLNPATHAVRSPRRYANVLDWAGLLHTAATPGTFANGVAYSWKGTEWRPFTFTVADTSGTRLASVTIRRAIGLDQQKEDTLTVPGNGFYGKFFQRAQSHPTPTHQAGKSQPAVLLFGGSEGGLYPTLERAASLLAARDHPALALAYFAGPSLPPDVNRTLPQALANIPLEYFVNAITWLRNQPGVDPNKIVVCGTSRGSEAALLLGASYPRLIHAVIANVPTNVVGWALTPDKQLNPWAPAWTHHGAALVPRTAIEVNRIPGRLFLDGGGMDRVWGTSDIRLMSQIEALRPRRSRDVVERYTTAGHGLGVLVPYMPHVFPSSVGYTLQGKEVLTNRVDDAWLWPKLLKFIGS